MKILVAIAHAGFLPDRTKSLNLLLAGLQEAGCTLPHLSVSKKQEHAKVWATRLWEWVAGQPDGTPCVLLNDDLTVHPDFMAVVQAMVTALPGELLALHAQHPEARKLAATGNNWFRCYWYTGPAVVIYPEHARELLEFAAFEKNQILWKGNEDNVAIHWAYQRQTPFFTSLPAIVKHDVTVKSTLGYDDHPNRVATVLWDALEGFPMDDSALQQTNKDYWAPVGIVPFVENPWAPTESLEAFRNGLHLCSFCLINQCVAGSAKTGARICKVCLSGCVQHALLGDG